MARQCCQMTSESKGHFESEPPISILLLFYALIFFYTLDIKNIIFNPKFYQHFLPSILISFFRLRALIITSLVYSCNITGTETVTITLTWALLLMAHYPVIQNRVRQEIHDNIGFDRLPSTSDRLQLRYTDAVLNEVQRFATISPNSVPHRAMRNVKFRGYDIPENAMILSNIYAVHHDENVWPDPNNFNPEANFIRRDESGEIGIVNTEHLIPFGVGRRVCLGESLARQELWIFFVGLMQRFQMSGNPKSSLPSIYKTTKNGIVQAPLLYELSIY